MKSCSGLSLIASNARVADNLLSLDLVADMALHVGAALQKARSRVAVGPPRNQRHVYRTSIDAEHLDFRINILYNEYILVYRGRINYCHVYRTSIDAEHRRYLYFRIIIMK
jgi:hypothetical protein